MTKKPDTNGTYVQMSNIGMHKVAGIGTLGWLLAIELEKFRVFFFFFYCLHFKKFCRIFFRNIVRESGKTHLASVQTRVSEVDIVNLEDDESEIVDGLDSGPGGQCFAVVEPANKLNRI